MAFGYVAEFNDWFRTRSELYQMVRDAFAANGIVVPYPRQDVRVFAGAASPQDDARYSA